MSDSFAKLQTELKAHFNKHIPIGTAINAELDAIDESSLTLVAPLSSNHNDHGDAFGGNLYALCVLAGWSALFLECRKRFDNPHIVTRDTQMRFRHPVNESTIKAVCRTPNQRQWDGFFTHYEKTGKATLSLSSTIYSGVISSDNQNPEPAARLEAVYVLLNK